MTPDLPSGVISDQLSGSKVESLSSSSDNKRASRSQSSSTSGDTTPSVSSKGNVTTKSSGGSGGGGATSNSGRSKASSTASSCSPSVPLSYEEELSRLRLFRNYLAVALSILPAKANKLTLLRVAALLEGNGEQYLLGGEPRPATLRRVLIYEREGQITPVKKKRTYKSSSGTAGTAQQVSAEVAMKIEASGSSTLDPFIVPGGVSSHNLYLQLPPQSASYLPPFYAVDSNGSSAPLHAGGALRSYPSVSSFSDPGSATSSSSGNNSSAYTTSSSSGNSSDHGGIGGQNTIPPPFMFLSSQPLRPTQFSSYPPPLPSTFTPPLGPHQLQQQQHFAPPLHSQQLNNAFVPQFAPSHQQHIAVSAYILQQQLLHTQHQQLQHQQIDGTTTADLTSSASLHTTRNSFTHPGILEMDAEELLRSSDSSQSEDGSTEGGGGGGSGLSSPVVSPSAETKKSGEDMSKD
eukprot:gene22833-29007_t